MKLDIKTLIVLFTIAATLGGFYYSTEIRLTHLEGHLSILESSHSDLQKQVQRQDIRIKRKDK